MGLRFRKPEKEVLGGKERDVLSFFTFPRTVYCPL